MGATGWFDRIVSASYLTGISTPADTYMYLPYLVGVNKEEESSSLDPEIDGGRGLFDHQSAC